MSYAEMISRISRLKGKPDPAGAASVQELMGGKFGEMSTFLNYTFQSFNFRNRQGARPFYDLIANIAAEEFGHVELVATAISTMLTGASKDDNGRARSPLATRDPLGNVKGVGNPHHFLAGGQGALPQNSQGRPWNGDYVFSSGDLVEDLTHNFFLETGARNNKLKVYEMVDHPVARALTGYLLVRGGVHQIAYARAVEKLTGADLSKMFPTPRIATEKIPECKPHIDRGDHLRLYRFRRRTTKSCQRSSTARIPRRGRISSWSMRLPRVCLPATSRRSRPSLLRTWIPRRSPRSPKISGKRPDCRRSRRGSSPI
jgi:Mn-containing catalase